MELKQLIYFKCVAENEHMTKAAARLGVAQPFLSKTIAALEEELGVELFDHVGRNIKLNQNGAFFYKRITAIVDDLDSTCKELTRMAIYAQSNVIEIASNMGLYIPWLLSYFQKRLPNIHITYSTTGREELIRMLREQAVDFVLCSPMLELPDLESRLLVNEECPIIYPPGHRLSQTGYVRLKDLANETFIGLKKGYSLRDESDRFFEVAGIKPRYAVEVSDVRTMWELVKSGCGIAFSSFTTLITDPILRENYKVVNDPPCFGRVGLSYRKDKKRGETFDQFTMLTAQFFKELQENARMG